MLPFPAFADRGQISHTLEDNMFKTLTTSILTILVLFAAVSAQQSAGETGRKSFRPSKTQITSAQEILKKSGSYSGPSDGKYNDEFRDSLKSYQTANSLEGTGKLDEPTLGNMGIALTDGQNGVKPKTGSKRTVFRVNKDQIVEAQGMLKQKGLYSGTADGKYSKQFRDSIKEFQSANGLRRSGSLNRATLEKLGIGLTETQSAIAVNPNDLASARPKGSRTGRRVFRASREQISNVQKMLAAKGLYSGEATGKLDPATRDAIKQWQDGNNVKVTGTLNKETLVAMGVSLTDSQKEM
jgi:peptidoglycan hydrolase-like protein with peptidoglycan-binding domain